jgi:inorganic phosphate transporter, PiT family
MANRIFISYRRSDDAGFALAIYEQLRQAFPRDSLFMDVKGSITPGDDFAKVLNTQVERCDVLLAIIGERWIDSRDEDGALRLWKKNDFVRIEIASALSSRKRVIPVLVNGAQMPRDSDLPPSLKKLADLQAVEIRLAHFGPDIQPLIGVLRKALREEAHERENREIEEENRIKREKWEKVLDQPLHPLLLVLFFGAMAAGFLFVAYSFYIDADEINKYLKDGRPVAGYLVPFLLLFAALVIALAFEFVNGFHDTANAVATVIYTRSLAPPVAVVWSGVFNCVGVLASTGGVAFGIVSMLPVELILQVGNTAGFAMVFALLIAAIIWNLGTWYLGLPASSTHTLYGSIIGIGIANMLMRGPDGTSGVDWSKAAEVGQSLLLSPLVGFAVAALLLVTVRSIISISALDVELQGDRPPPWWIRGLLILTCTSVSYAHGSNDGQKGMGLILLILIGTAPTAYALNRTLQPAQIADFQDASTAAEKVIDKQAFGYNMLGDPRDVVKLYVSRRQIEEGTYPALALLVKNISSQVERYGTLAQVPADAVRNTRNDMYLASEAVRFLLKDNESGLSGSDVAALNRYKASLDLATRYIPTWVKIATALALGLGTMMGWKRIVITVGERIGRTHLTYAQGASAELVTAATVGMADRYGLPVSTTHVLSSGVAGTMAATDNSGLQWLTIRNIILGWVLTLPVAILVSATLYWAFSHMRPYLTALF